MQRLEADLRQTQSYVIENSRTGQQIGFCQAYDLNLAEGWCSFLVYTVPQHQRTPHPAEATLIFLDLLFKYFPLRKVYADIFEYNGASYHILTKYGFFQEEARLPNHIWYEDRYWAVIKLALYRDGYYKAREWAHNILQVQHDVNSVMAQRPAQVDGGHSD